MSKRVSNKSNPKGRKGPWARSWQGKNSKPNPDKNRFKKFK